MAIEEAKKALKTDNTPIGCVIVYNDKVIAKAYNKKNSLNDPTKHAEIIAISKACKSLNSWRLNDCDLYVTLEPCYMCKGAIAEARIKNVYYLLSSNYYEMLDVNKSNISFSIVEDKYNYKSIIGNFFKNKR